MRHLYLLFTSLCLGAISVNAQNTDLQEVVSKRDMFSKTYQKANGKMEAVISNQPVHYESNGAWLPIDQTILHDGVSFVNQTNVFRTEFPSIFSSSDKVTFTIDNDEVQVSLSKEYVSYENGLNAISTATNSAQATLQGNTIRYGNFTASVTDEYEVLNGSVKNNFILQSVPQELQNINSGLFGFREDVTLPEGWRITSSIETNNELIPYGLFILNESDEIVFDIPAPIFFDDLGLGDDGESQVQGAYLIEEENGVWKLSTLVPVNWLKDPARVYPLTIDPTVTIAGTAGGWQSQNNYVDNTGFVFIGVCCGNLEHRAWLKWNVSSIPDNACVTMTECQVYVNGVGASTAELVHFYDMMATTTTGLFGPYGGIIGPVYNDQGNGYYTSCTMTGTGYYGYYDLGANANADVMNLMNSYDWYQVALIFDNEPSTNWKRMTGTMCNLRITYDNPPCTPLPVEVTDIEVDCNEGRPVMSWTSVSESNNDFYTIWRSTDGTNYQEIAQISGQGNSTEATDYIWSASARDNEKAYYRLSQTDYDGAIEYFNAKVFNGCDIIDPIITVDNHDKITIEGEAIQEVIIADHTGRLISSVSNHEHKASINIDPDVDKGFYVISVIHHDGLRKATTIYLEK